MGFLHKTAMALPEMGRFCGCDRDSLASEAGHIDLDWVELIGARIHNAAYDARVAIQVGGYICRQSPHVSDSLLGKGRCYYLQPQRKVPFRQRLAVCPH